MVGALGLVEGLDVELFEPGLEADVLATDEVASALAGVELHQGAVDVLFVGLFEEEGAVGVDGAGDLVETGAEVADVGEEAEVVLAQGLTTTNDPGLVVAFEERSAVEGPGGGPGFEGGFFALGVEVAVTAIDQDGEALGVDVPVDGGVEGVDALAEVDGATTAGGGEAGGEGAAGVAQGGMEVAGDGVALGFGKEGLDELFLARPTVGGEGEVGDGEEHPTEAPAELDVVSVVPPAEDREAEKGEGDDTLFGFGHEPDR